MEQTEKKKNVKRYYWLKLKEEFFLDKEVKKLRKIAGGDTYTIIYLKLMLLSLKTDGKLYFDGIEDTFAEELALEIDEETENVRVTLMYLEKMRLLKVMKEDEIYLTQMDNLICSESESAQRVRKHREKLKQIECNGYMGETQPITEIEDNQGDVKALQCNSGVTNCNGDETTCNTYTEAYANANINTKTIINKNKKEEEEEEKPVKKIKNKVFMTEYHFSDSDIVQASFDEFLKMRMATKRGMTERAIQQLKAKLEKLSKDEYEQADILDQSTFKTWSDIYPLREDFVSIRERPKSVKPVAPPENDEPSEEWKRMFDECEY